MAPSVLETLRRAADGDVRAQGALFEAWMPKVLGWCLRLGGPKVDAEDVAHDVFMVVLRRVETLEHLERPDGWLFGITRRVLRQHRTRAWVQRWTGSEAPPNTPDPSANPGLDFEAQETTRRVQALMEAIPERAREVLILCDLEERTAPEVAALLGIPVGTVASRLRTGRTRFAELAKQRSLSEWLEIEPEST